MEFKARSEAIRAEIWPCAAAPSAATLDPMNDLGNEILDLVRVGSVTGHEAGLADRLERRLREGTAGRRHDILRRGHTLVVSPRGPGLGAPAPASGSAADPDAPDPPVSAPRRPMLLLAGHIDTVPRADAPDPARIGERVIGRGACDMKAGVAVMLSLLEELDPDEGFADRVYLFYEGEEGPASGNGLRRILEEEPWLCRARLGILLEPTRGELELGCNGSIHVTVTFTGRPCHSARPWMGRHPLADALRWFEEVLALPPRDASIAGVTFREVVTLTRLKAGEVRNVVPGTLEANLNLRYPPDRSRAEAETLLRSILPEGAKRGGFVIDAEADADAGANAKAVASSPAVTAELADHSPPGRIDLDDPFYRHLLESTGLPRRAKQGWTDVARLTAHGIPALNWGPGDPELAHTRDEFVDLAEAERCLAAMRHYLLGPGPETNEPAAE